MISRKVFELGCKCKPRNSFHMCTNAAALSFAFGRISLPVAKFASVVNMLWSLGNPGLFTHFPELFTFFGALSSSVFAFLLPEQRNQVWSFGIQILVDCLM